MNNHPFVVTSTNVIDESFFTATPTYVNGQNVFVSQEKQRKLFDNLNTSIIGISPSAGGPQFYPGNFIQAERYYGPSGMIFTFPSGPSNPPGVPVQGSLQFNRFNPYPLPPNGLRNDVLHSPGPPFQGSAPMNYRTLPLPGLRSPQYQEQLAQNPFYFQPQQLPGYKLRFHLNEGTSCSDLLNSDNQVPGSQGAPDFKNLAGLMYQLDSANNYPTDPTNAPICYPNSANDLASNVKRLVINKPVESPQQHVADILDEQKQDQVEEQKDKKGVTFSNQPDKAEKGDQTSFPYCNCNNAGSRNGPNTENDNTNSRRNPVKNFFRRKSAKYDSDKYSSDNSEKEQPKRNRTNKGKNKKSKGKKEEPEYDSETSDSEYVCRCTI